MEVQEVLHCIGGVKVTILIIVISMVYILSEVVVSLGKELNVVVIELAFSLVLSR